MEKMTKRIILSIVTLVLVVVALGTTTFAWFTLSNIATVSDISGEVQAGEGLEIAFGDNLGARITTGYKTRLTKDDWAEVLGWEKTAGVKPYDGFKFGAASTINGEEFYNLVEGADQVLNKTLVEAPNTNGGYLEFSIHFRSRSAGDVYWTGYEMNSTSIFDFIPDMPYVQTVGEGGNQDGTTETQVTFKPHAINGLRIAVANDTEVVEIVQNGTTDSNQVMEGNGILAGQFSYLKNKGVKINWGTVEAPSIVTDPTTIAIKQAETSVNKVVVTLVADTENAGFYIGQVNVRVWIEGWDADTYDSIFNLPFAFNLTFEKKE